MGKKDAVNEKEVVAEVVESPPAEATSTAMVAARNNLSPSQLALVEARVTFTQALDDVAKGVDDKEVQSQLMRLQRGVNPMKKGQEELNTQWSPPVVRIVQNMTKDKPEGANVGDLYTNSGSVIKPPFEFIPLYIFEVNRMFSGDNTSAPTCTAPDAKLGTMFGTCVQCLNYPAPYNKNNELTECDNGICLMVLAKNMRVYQLEFFKTSRKAGAKIVQLTNEWDLIWERWATLSTREVSNPKGTFFVYSVSAGADNMVSEPLQQASEYLYDMIAVMRKQLLEAHWARVTSGDEAEENINESVDADSVKVAPENANPDMTGEF